MRTVALRAPHTRWPAIPAARLKGMHHLARLLAAPGLEFHVLDLVAGDTDDPTAAARLPRAADAGTLLDDRAKQMYRRRLTEIEEDLEEARADNDLARQEQAQIRLPDQSPSRP